MNDPQFIGYLRIAYVASQALALLTYYFITMKVSSFLRIGSEVELTGLDPKKERFVGPQIRQPAIRHGQLRSLQ